MLDRVEEICYNKGVNGAYETVYSYEYDAGGRLHSVTDHPNDEVTVYTYTPTGNLSSYYVYDLTTYRNLYGSQLQYDDQSRLTKVYHRFEYGYGASKKQEPLRYRYYYNADNLLSAMTINENSTGFGGIITPEYDVFGRTNSKTVELTVDSNQVFYNRLSYGYEMYPAFEADYESARVWYVANEIGKNESNTTTKTYSYAYDDNGNITKIWIDGILQYQYAYDNLGQLIREDNRPLGYSYVYTYDNAGNILSKKRYAFTTGTLGAVQQTISCTYGNALWGDQLTGFDGETIVYDEIGNPIFIGTDYGNGSGYGYVLTWQGRQLTSYRYCEYWNDGAYYDIFEEYYYTYNADGIRTSKTVNGIRHDYVLNGSQIVAETWTENGVEYDMLYLYDELGSPIGFRYRDSTYANGRFDEFFFEKNLQGDIVAIYNEYGVQIGTYTYDAWGKCRMTLASDVTVLESRLLRWLNPFRYRGYYYDYEVGLYYLQSRYYDPDTGRFLNADGYISTGTGVLGYNMYTYCNNNPLLYFDPCGGCPKHFSYTDGCDICYDERIMAYLAGYTQEDEESLFVYNPEEELANILAAAEHHKRGTTSPSNLGKHQKGQARKQRDQGQEKGDQRRKSRSNKRKFSIVVSDEVAEKIVAGVIVIGATGALICLIGNDTTGVGVADDTQIPVLLPIIWDNTMKVFS